MIKGKGTMMNLVDYFYVHDTRDGYAVVGQIVAQLSPDTYLLQPFDKNNERLPFREVVTLAQMAAEKWKLIPNEEFKPNLQVSNAPASRLCP